MWQAVKDSEPLRKAVEEVQPLHVVRLKGLGFFLQLGFFFQCGRR